MSRSWVILQVTVPQDDLSLWRQSVTVHQPAAPRDDGWAREGGVTANMRVPSG